MHRVPLLGAACATLALAAPADAETITIGSDLSAAATVTEARAADTAFWASTSSGNLEIPVDGQVTQIKVRGSAIQEQGAKPPATLVHFQSLEPAQANGRRAVYLSSQDFYMPYNDPAAVTSFEPENLCVRKGGAVAFNTIGGFKWGGSLDAPLDERHYFNGTPWQIFAAAPRATTLWYTKDNGTKNGMTLDPAAGGDNASGVGGTLQGKELLMQVTVVTGDDRSQSCGGPRRDGNGNTIKDITVNPGQDMYVTRDGKFSVLGYCGTVRGDCSNGTVTVTVDGRTIATGSFSAKQQETIKVPLTMSQADYIALANAPNATRTATVTFATPSLGEFSDTITLHTTAGGAMSIPAQKPYVSNSRALKPYFICSLPTGCAGTAKLTAKGKTIAAKRFKTTKRGAVMLNMKLNAGTFRALKKARTLVATLVIASNAGNATKTVILRK